MFKPFAFRQNEAGQAIESVAQDSVVQDSNEMFLQEIVQLNEKLV